MARVKAVKTAKSRTVSKARDRIKLATSLRKVFERRAGKPRQVVISPFDKINEVIDELKGVASKRNEKMYKLYLARKVTVGMRTLLREMQQSGAYARTVIDEFVNMVVEEHSKLLRANNPVIGRSIPVPSVDDLIKDIDALEKQFEHCESDRTGFHVTTKPISLWCAGYEEDVHLGRFKITIPFNAGNRNGRWYMVTALEPNTCNGFPHPHVQSNGGMCEGEAAYPIRHALDNGLLLEFFMIIYNTLITYNSSSPFIQLDAWLGGGRNSDGEYDYYCERCDRGMSEDDAYTCAHCEALVCDSCSEYCEHSAETICDSCLRTYRTENRGCDDCGQFTLEGCRIRQNPSCHLCGCVSGDDKTKRCPATSRVICSNCIDKMIAADKPCSTRDRMPYWQRRELGRRQDGVCSYVCANTRMNKSIVEKCPLRERGYAYKPTKPTEGTGKSSASGKEQEEGAKAAKVKVGSAGPEPPANPFL